MFHGVHRQNVISPIKFETEFAQDFENCGAASEMVHIRGSVRWPRGQTHGEPTFRVYGEEPSQRRAIHDRQVRSVRNIVGKVVHIYGCCV